MMSEKTTLSGLTAMRAFKKKPVKVAINDELDGNFRKLSVSEYEDLQDKIGKLKDGEDAVDNNVDLVAGMMIKVLCDDNGEPVFVDADKDELKKTITIQFLGEFMQALARSQGATKEAVEQTEASFRG